MNRSLLVALSLAAGCAPQTASVSVGDYTAFLAATNSLTAQRASIDFEAYNDADAPEGSYYHAVDCREFAAAGSQAENEQLRLDNRLPICEGDPGVEEPFSPTHEIWLDQNGYIVLGARLDPWRGEAVVTSEGDLQIGFHQRLPGGEDFRFAFVVDPDFQPRNCEQNEAGDGVELAEIDGNWVDNWSQDADGGRLYYLNSGSYQFDPEDPENLRWFFPIEWRAGFAAGKFGDDLFQARSSRYGLPEIYIGLETDSLGEDIPISAQELFYCGPGALNTPDVPPGSPPVTAPPHRREILQEGDDPATNGCMMGELARVEEIASNVGSELRTAGFPARVGEGEWEGLPGPAPRIHANLWREPDGRAPGLDGWIGLHYNWVRFDEGSELEQGGAASGEFSLLFDALDSQSRFVVRGRFEVKRFTKDRWTTEYIPPIKFEENETSFCGLPPGEGIP